MDSNVFYVLKIRLRKTSREPDTKGQSRAKWIDVRPRNNCRMEPFKRAESVSSTGRPKPSQLISIYPKWIEIRQLNVRKNTTQISIREKFVENC